MLSIRPYIPPTAKEYVGELEECHSVLSQLVALKDGPRDDSYREQKDEAWSRARRALGLEEHQEPNETTHNGF